MPRVSLLAKDASKGGSKFSAQEGWWEVGKCYSTVYEFAQSEEQKNKREAPNRSTMVMLELFKLNPTTLERIEDEPVEERLGFGGKNGLDVLRPGRMKSADSSDIEDLGTEDGVEGNTIYGEEGVVLSDNCTWIIFSNSAEKAGFDPTKIGTGYLPYFEGTKFEVERVKAFKSSKATAKQIEKWEKYGDPTNLAIKKIAVFGYDKKASGKAAAKAGAAKAAASSANGADKSNGADSEETAKAALTAIATANAGKSIKRAVFQAAFLTHLMRNTQLDRAGKTSLMAATVQDDEWLAIASTEHGFVVDFDAGMVEFP